MRLDKYLKVSRIIKRRTLAAEACSAGRAQINGRPAKAGDRVKPGDVIELLIAGQKQRYEVVGIDEHAGKSEAELMFKKL